MRAAPRSATGPVQAEGAALLLPPVAPAALVHALEQSHEVKAKVEACAEELSDANEETKRSIADGVRTLPARQTLDQSEAVEAKVQECADDLEDVTTSLAQGIDDLKLVEAALAHARLELAEANQSLESALASEERATFRALHDPLTGLPNRVLFNDRLAHALALAERHGWTVAVLFLDLDHFKQVNDVHGHAAGDAVLVEIAKRLAQGARAEDTVCRNGGDEFLVLLMHPQGRANIARIAVDVIQNLSRTMDVGGQPLRIRPSIGIALYPQDGGSGEMLVQNADAAMYRAKKTARGHAFYAPATGRRHAKPPAAG